MSRNGRFDDLAKQLRRKGDKHDDIEGERGAQRYEEERSIDTGGIRVSLRRNEISKCDAKGKT